MRFRSVAVGACAAWAWRSSPSQAGHAHAIQTANSPSTGQPIAGGGRWIVNRADAYYLGQLMPGSTFDNEYTDGRNWHAGRAFGNVQMCGWVMPCSLPAHLRSDGSDVPALAGCGLYYNYFYGSDFRSNYGHPADYAGGISSIVMYRYTTNDGYGAVVRDPVLGWGFTFIGCVQRPSPLYNDND